MAERIFAVDENYDFPEKVAQRQAERLGEQVETPGSPLKRSLDNSYGRSATYNFTDTVATDKARPDFVRTGVELFTAADTGQASIYWLSVIEVPEKLNLPEPFMWVTSTDHDNGAGGIALGYSSAPDVAPSSWETINITGLPSNLYSIETAMPWVDLQKNRILVYFQAADTATNRSQDTHVMQTLDGLTFTYVTKIPDVPTLWPGDGHGGYLGPLMPYGTGYVAYTLSGGTDLSRARMMLTQDGIQWAAIGPPESSLFPAYASGQTANVSKINMRPFLWRGQKWAVGRSSALASGGTEAAFSSAVVYQVSEDYRMIIGSPHETLMEPLPDETATDNSLSSVLYYNGQLYSYYRCGGKAGSYRLAVSEA